jgi:hypothetical protein
MTCLALDTEGAFGGSMKHSVVEWDAIRGERAKKADLHKTLLQSHLKLGCAETLLHEQQNLFDTIRNLPTIIIVYALYNLNRTSTSVEIDRF